MLNVQPSHHVLFVNRVFPPDRGATGQYLHALAAELLERGWRVSIVVAKTVSRTEPDTKGIVVRRMRGLPYRRKPMWYRAIAYLSLYPAMLWGIWRVGRPDVIVVMTDPPLFFSAAVFYAKWRRIPVIHWCQDVYPELAFALGLIKETGIIGRTLVSLRTHALDRCGSIVAIGGCMARVLRGRTSAAIEIVPNWSELAHTQPSPQEANPFRANLLPAPNGQIVMYSGNIGLGHPFDAILAAMDELGTDRPTVRFAVIGDGPRLNDLKAEVERRALKNVIFFPHQPNSNLGQTLGAADIHLACMEPDLLGLIAPSKVYGILAAGRPCIFLGPAESEVAVAISHSGAGEVLPPGRQHELGARLRVWLDDQAARESAGRNARSAAEQNSIARSASAFDRILREALLQPHPADAG